MFTGNVMGPLASEKAAVTPCSFGSFRLESQQSQSQVHCAYLAHPKNCFTT